MFCIYFFRAFTPIFHFKLCNFVGGDAKIFSTSEQRLP